MSDFVVTNGTAKSLRIVGSQTEYSANFRVQIEVDNPNENQSVSVHIVENAVVDRNGNSNPQSNVFTYTYVLPPPPPTTSEIRTLFSQDTDIPAVELPSEGDIDLILNAAFHIPITTNPFDQDNGDDGGDRG